MPLTLPRLNSKPLRILDFDIETVAAGFGDPQWVPNRTVVWAFSWVGSDEADVSALTPACFYDKEARREFLRPLLDEVRAADVLTGHNLLRFDLLVLNAECLLLGLPTLRPVLVQDTMRLPKSKGFRKGQDNLGHAFGVRDKKLSLSWAEWEAAYDEDGLDTVQDRCVSDVLMHVKMRAAMLERGVLAAPKVWRP